MGKTSSRARYGGDVDSPDTGQAFSSLEGSPDPSTQDVLTLKDGARIAVIGGGPSGSLFAFFALTMSDMLGRKVQITIFEPKNFLGRGPSSCNYCGGIVSELMVQTLAIEGINLPSSVVQRGINSYQLYTDLGDVRIETPALEKTIASVYRGGGPRGVAIDDKESFDNFLLKKALSAGAEHNPLAIDRVILEKGRPVLFSGGEKVMEADLLVGAFGVNARTTPVFEGIDFAYKRPRVTKTAIAEIALDPAYISRTFGNSVHLFLLPIKKIKFAAIIPKSSYVTLCILGRDLSKKNVESFLSHPKVKGLFPKGESGRIACMCLPLMNVGAPKKPYADRVVMIGDAGSTRLYKDGIGAAYFMGKSAAKTIVMHGVGERHFRKYFMPDYRSLITDNIYGRYLFWVTDLFRDVRLLTAVMLRVVRKEQGDRSDRSKILSHILWDMFTGNERYRAVFIRAVCPELIVNMTRGILRQLWGGGNAG